jgi:predicted acyl esterase
MRRGILILLAAAGVMGQVRFPGVYPPANDVVMDNLVAVPMRDGVKLFADVYRPKEPGR